MDDILEKTVELVFSSKRAMPAHFSSNGSRTQSFCIDFEPLTESDDYEMASEAWNSPRTKNVPEPQFMPMVMCGENIMVGAFIITKFNRKDLIEEMKKIIIADTIESFRPQIELQDIVLLKEVIAYFDHCANYGSMRAESEQ